MIAPEVPANQCRVISGEPSWDEIDEVIDKPFSSVEVAEFRSFLRPGPEQGRTGRHHTFGLEAGDVPRLTGEHGSIADDRGEDVMPPAGAQPIAKDEAYPFLTQCDGRSSLSEIANRLGWSLASVYATAHSCMRVGLQIKRYDALRNRMPLLEVCRWPSAESMVPMPYWRNAIEVREQLELLPRALTNKRDFFRYLRRLHVASLMGMHLDSFYAPQSAFLQISAYRHVGPGEFRPEGTIQCSTNNAWHPKLLVENLCGQNANFGNAPALSADGIVMGETRWTWSHPSVDLGRHVYIPINGLRLVHLNLMYDTFCDAIGEIEAGRSGALGKLAELFRVFICLHPFAYGNMALGMNILNWGLRHIRGGYVPHTMLDGWAHRTDQKQFEQIFSRYTDRYLIPAGSPGPDQRGQCSIDEFFAFVSLTTEQAARTWLHLNPSKAQMALLA